MADDEVLQAFRRAAGDRVHGAAEIEKRLISDLLASRTSWAPHKLSAGAVLLAGSQPAMAPLVNLAGHIGGGDLVGLELFFEQRLKDLTLLPAALASGAVPWIERAEVVVSISRSSSVAAALEGAWCKEWNGTVVVLDGSSAGGGPEQASRLGRYGTVVSQPDAVAPRWLDTPDALVAVGADAVGQQRFVNCIGSRALLEAAFTRGVPAILIADRGKDVPETGIDEIVGNVPLHNDSSGREWPLFEAIPLALVSARISD